MLQQFLMGALGLMAGFVAASGVVAFIISIGIVPRYAGITKQQTRSGGTKIVVFWELFWGTCSIFGVDVCLFGTAGVAVFGLFAGIYLGSWIIALGEVVDIFAIIARRIGLTRGLGAIILCMAAGENPRFSALLLSGMGALKRIRRLRNSFGVAITNL